MPRVNSRQQPFKLDLLGALQGYYAVEILLQMLRAGALSQLSRPRTTRQLSSSLAVDEKLLDPVLQFVIRSTDILEYAAGRYKLKPASFPELSFQLEKFAGAYGQGVRNFSRLLRGRRASAVDQGALARAFSGVRGVDCPVLHQLRKSGVRRLLEMGCGPAWTLVQLGITDPRFEAFGIEKNRAMFALARTNVRQFGLKSRIRIRLGDARHPEQLLSRAEQRGIEAIYGRSFLNEFFGRGETEVVRLLRHLRQLFPGRIAWFTDYYGELSRPRSGPRQSRLGLLQDVAQITSSQGIPPAARQDWERIYAKAGCRLTDAEEFQTADLRWFTHKLQL